MSWTSQRLSTDRLILRPFTDDDTDSMIVLLTDPAVRQYLGGSIEVPDGFTGAAISDQWGAWCVARADTGEAVGSCTFSRDRGRLELSYSLIPPAWGHGYAAEACSTVLDWVWDDTEEPSVIAVTQTANEPSMNLLARLGFAEEHRFDEFGAEQSMQSLRRPIH